MQISKQSRLLRRQSISLTYQTYSRVPTAEDTPTQLIEHGEVQLMPTWKLYPLSYSLLATRKYSIGDQKKNMDTNPATKPLTYNLSCLQNTLR